MCINCDALRATVKEVEDVNDILTDEVARLTRALQESRELGADLASIAAAFGGGQRKEQEVS